MNAPWNTSEIEGGGIISLVGAGGKTTLMFSLAKWLAAQGKKIITTTTTKIYVPTPAQTPAVVVSETVDRLTVETGKMLEKGRHVTIGAKYLADGNKIQGLSTEALSSVSRAGIADWIIVEADGAAGRPIKAPAFHEPVVPAETRVVIGVVGLVSAGRTFDANNVFRTAHFASVTGLRPGEPITPRAVAEVLLHEEGIMKGAPAGAAKFAFLNTAQRGGLAETGCEIARVLHERGADRLRGILCGAASEGPAGWQAWNGAAFAREYEP